MAATKLTMTENSVPAREQLADIHRKEVITSFDIHVSVDPELWRA
jgi:hypothetical protein